MQNALWLDCDTPAEERLPGLPACRCCSKRSLWRWAELQPLLVLICSPQHSVCSAFVCSTSSCHCSDLVLENDTGDPGMQELDWRTVEPVKRRPCITSEGEPGTFGVQVKICNLEQSWLPTPDVLM